MFANMNGWHLVIILAIVLLLFGAPRLPGLAKSVGQSLKIFRGEVKTSKDESSELSDVHVDDIAAGATVPQRD